jgi:predicted RNA binding protein YcfA (HicA-like mRNA interferase family)
LRWPSAQRRVYSETIAVLEKIGFTLSRQSDSHRTHKNGAGKRATVPFHAAKVLHPKVIKGILLDTDLNVERLNELL